MAKTTLQLNNYFFPIINIVANPNWTNESADGKGPPVSNCVVKLEKDETNENIFQISVSIDVIDTADNPSQYNISLVAVGWLTADEDMPNKEQNMSITGASILYSASREFILQLTSRGPFPPIMLSPMYFGVKPANEDEEK